MAAAKKANTLSQLGTPGKVALGVFMLLLPAIGYYVVFHSDIQSTINAEQARNAKLKSQLVVTRKAEHAYQKDLEELRERERTKRELTKVLPVTTEYPAFLSSIQNVSNLVGIELRAWTPEEEVPEEFYARVPMKLELTGRFHQLAKFFYNVGRIERIINMENISVSMLPGTDGEPKLSVVVLATAFHAVEEVVNDGPTKGRRRRERGR